MNCNFSRFSTAALFLASATIIPSVSSQQEIPFEEHPSYNPNEELMSFDVVMKPYAIPVQGTTYTNFYFNVPEDLPEYFHVVFGETLNSQPRHLHHFVLYGCEGEIDPSIEGLPYEDKTSSGWDSYVDGYDDLPIECESTLGTWTPGSTTMGVTDTETGFLMGHGMGHKVLRLNIHYTDGVYADPEKKTQVMATDGMRIYYTTNFRPYTTQALMLNEIPYSDDLVVPPQESRFFVTKTCKVGKSCKDVSDDSMQYFALNWTPETLQPFDFGSEIENLMIGATSCASVQPLCNVDHPLLIFFKQVCPVTCGFCDEGSPFNPESFRVDKVWYHAHLLGSEMYTTLIREEETGTMVKDLASQDFWNFDYQYHFPLDDEMIQDGKVMKGTEVKPGDKIQVTCVYNSMYEDEPTAFGFSTYEEMCDQYTYVTFETPETILSDVDHVLSPIDQLRLMTFRCYDEDEESNIYTGTLTEEEDGRDIWKNHPIEAAEGCKFITSWNGFASKFTQDTVNCPADVNSDNGEEEEAIISAASKSLGRAAGFTLLSTTIAVLSSLAW